MAWSSPIVVTAATSEPVAATEVKTFLRIDGTALDSQIDAFIAAARDEIEQTTSTRLLTQTIKISADFFEDLACLPIGPVTSVTALKYVDVAGDEQTIDPAVYELFGAGLEAGIRLKVGQSWPAARAASGTIRATLVVGYGDADAVPPSLHLAMLRLVRGMLDDAPADVEAQLVNHRIWL